MINSLFMLGSSYNKDKKISKIFMGAWILYMIIGNKFAMGNTFVYINAGIFLILSLLINSIKNKRINTILSIFSILIWSIIIDIICYYMYPMMSMGQNLLTYVGQGILFNYKYIFSNVIAVCLINAVIWIIDNIEVKIKNVIKA